MLVNEMFNSISGEVSPVGQGRRTTFLRLTGCNVRPKCRYCDTYNGYAKNMSRTVVHKTVQELLEETGNLCITGGEPLLQIDDLQFGGFFDFPANIWVETNGTIDFSTLVGTVGIVADYKPFLYNKGEYPKYFNKLTETDYVKFVIGDKEEFEYCMEAQWKMPAHINFAYSPIHDVLAANVLLKWMEEANMRNTILNVQIHKLIGLK